MDGPSQTQIGPINVRMTVSFTSFITYEYQQDDPLK